MNYSYYTTSQISQIQREVCSSSLSFCTMLITDFHSAVQSLLLPSTIMRYTSKVALLAVAFFGVSVLAVPLQVAPGSQYDLEAREFDNDLFSRGFYDMYLDARDLESLDLEPRVYTFSDYIADVSLFGL